MTLKIDCVQSVWGILLGYGDALFSIIVSSHAKYIRQLSDFDAVFIKKVFLPNHRIRLPNQINCERTGLRVFSKSIGLGWMFFYLCRLPWRREYRW
jgi:hypothetical protein